MKYTIVIAKLDGTVDVIGEFDSERSAAWHEDRYIDAPPGSRAFIAPMQHPDEYGSGESPVERAREHRRRNPPPTN